MAKLSQMNNPIASPLFWFMFLCLCGTCYSGYEEWKRYKEWRQDQKEIAAGLRQYWHKKEIKRKENAAQLNIDEMRREGGL